MFGWRRWTPSWNLPSSRRQRANSCLTKLSRQSVSAKSGSLDSSIPTARVILHGWSSTRRYIVIIGPWFLFLSLIGILLHLLLRDYFKVLHNSNGIFFFLPPDSPFWLNCFKPNDYVKDIFRFILGRGYCQDQVQLIVSKRQYAAAVLVSRVAYYSDPR